MVPLRIKYTLHKMHWHLPPTPSILFLLLHLSTTNPAYFISVRYRIPPSQPAILQDNLTMQYQYHMAQNDFSTVRCRYHQPITIFIAKHMSRISNIVYTFGGINADLPFHEKTKTDNSECVYNNTINSCCHFSTDVKMLNKSFCWDVVVCFRRTIEWYINVHVVWWI